MKSSFSRRALLASGTLAGVGAAWTSLSDSWSARFLRSRMAEFGQDVPPAPHTPAPATWNDNAVTLAWLGHATALINFYGLRILTDPVLFNRIGVDLGIGSLGPQRLVQLRPHGRCPARDRSGARVSRALRPSRHAVARRDARPAGGGNGRGHLRLVATALLLGRPRAAVGRRDHRNDAARRRAGPRDRGQALGRTDPARHLSRLRWLRRRARGEASAHRRRHREHRRLRRRIAATARSRPRLCRLAPTIRGSPTTARPSRR